MCALLILFILGGIALYLLLYLLQSVIKRVGLPLLCHKILPLLVKKFTPQKALF